MDENKKVIVYALEESDIVVNELKNRMHDCQVFAFSGPLGAGKTTTVKALLRSCGVTGIITSPTFTYVNEYKNGQGDHFYHFDLYRITSVDEFQGQGFDEYLYQFTLRSSQSEVGPRSWSFIEWPEVIKPLLTHNVCWVTFDYHDDAHKRMVTIQST